MTQFRDFGEFDYVIAGGGTAGHIIPGLAIAEQLIEQGRAPLSIAFVASQRPSDQRLLADSQHPRLLLNVDGLQRSISPRALWRTATALVKLIVASAQAGRQFRQWQPRVVVSVGGFASAKAGFTDLLARSSCFGIEPEDAQVGA